MKKILSVVLMLLAIQGFAETIVKGKYEKKRKRYVELTQEFIKEINLTYTLGNNKNDIVTYKTENYDILVEKKALLELYNKGKKEKISDIKNEISSKDKKLDFIYNDVAELIESNRAVIYDRKNKKEIKHLFKVKYNNNIYYERGGSNYYGYQFYTDKSLKDLVLKFDIITKFGIAIHSSLGNNPYNRELTEREKELKNKYDKKFEEKKQLYKKAVMNPDIEQSFSY